MDQDILTMLELIRLEGIIKMLWDTIDHDELAETVHVICQNTGIAHERQQYDESDADDNQDGFQCITP